MGRITAYGMHLSPNVIALPVKFYITTTRAKTLDLSHQRTLSLIGDEQHIMPLITQHGFEVVDATPGACAVASNYDSRLSDLGQTIDHGQIRLGYRP